MLLYCIMHVSLTAPLPSSLFSVKPRKERLAHKHWAGAGAHGKCGPCPVIHPSPVCGSDGHTYSSKVRRIPPQPIFSLSLVLSFFNISFGCSFIVIGLHTHKHTHTHTHTHTHGELRNGDAP
ncbi:unnamed protein product [Oncorhynchus mykiss]|uniref:Kazal-like domain-containing protein n=1 Tax=Oncorhynchus mykiss TaxID=8022 RepID=A0A060Z7N4_ONCMY|nr:unnamed protein product [Oncorhynchus mykiss]